MPKTINALTIRTLKSKPIQLLIIVAGATIWLLAMLPVFKRGGTLGFNAPTDTPLAIPGMTGLWPDVPPLPGASPDDTFSALLGQFPSGLLPIVYYTGQTPAEAAAFYTNDRMKTQGWEPQPYDTVTFFSVGHGEGPQIPTGSTPGGCQVDNAQSPPLAFCTFSKTDELDRHVELAITMTIDAKTGRTMLTYIRQVSRSK